MPGECLTDDVKGGSAGRESTEKIRRGRGENADEKAKGAGVGGKRRNGLGARKCDSVVMGAERWRRRRDAKILRGGLCRSKRELAGESGELAIRRRRGERNGNGREVGLQGAVIGQA